MYGHNFITISCRKSRIHKDKKSELIKILVKQQNTCGLCQSSFDKVSVLLLDVCPGINCL